MRKLVTLLTDFGERDSYAAQMKGVICSLCPRAVVVDLGHEIRPHAVREAALFIAEAAPRFPKDTVHVVVVDPGVGTSRRPLAVSGPLGVFVCPDNGVLSLVLSGHPRFEARLIDRAALAGRGGRLSATFHGRDIFAPAAARLACGLPFRRIGPVAEDIATLDIPRPRQHGSGEVRGEVIHVDRFGNCITNIPRSMVGPAASRSLAPEGTDAPGAAALDVRLPGHGIDGVCSTYGDAAVGTALALWGSGDLLEIAVNQGSAVEGLGLAVGSPVRVLLRRAPSARENPRGAAVRQRPTGGSPAVGRTAAR